MISERFFDSASVTHIYIGYVQRRVVGYRKMVWRGVARGSRMVWRHLCRVKLGILVLVIEVDQLHPRIDNHTLCRMSMTSIWRHENGKWRLFKIDSPNWDIWRPPTPKSRRSSVTIVEQVCEQHLATQAKKPRLHLSSEFGAVLGGCLEHCRMLVVLF